MRLLSYALLSSASVAALAFAAPASAQTPQPVHPERDPCQAPADQRDPNVNCPPADTNVGQAIQQGNVTSAAAAGDQGIVVVGSRIRRNRFNTADPVTIITRDQTVDAGFNSTSEALQSVGVTGGTGQITDTFGGLVVDGGPGVNTLGLRGLGATRTLILLNGRRLAPEGTRGSVGAADLNVLPNALLDRIEVLNTGASSIYGSDAVAGVVNIVTLKKFDGLKVEAQVSAPEVGAGLEQRYSLVAGTSGSRFSVLGSLEFYDRNRLAIGDLSWARCPRQLRLNGAGTEKGSGDFIDPRTGQSKCFPLEEGGVTVNTIGTGFSPGFPVSSPSATPGFPAGYNIYCSRWRPNAGVTGGPLPGFECVTGFLYNPATQTGFNSLLNYRDTSSSASFRQDVISPTRTYTGFLTATYDTDFFGDGQIYAELLATRRQSQQNGQRQFTIDYPRNSPLLSPAFRTLPLSSSIGIRVFADYGIYDSHQTQDYVKASAGFRGDLTFLKGWRYDLYGAKSWSDGTYSFEQILADRLAASLNVLSNGDGTFRCASGIPGCIAAPVLTTDIVAGRFRDVASDWFNYVTSDVVGHTAFREWTGNLTLDGPLFHLQGGDAQAAVGVEYRHSYINDVPSEDAQRNNLYNFTSAPITRGSDAVWEGFGEVELPIFRDAPLAKSLTLNGSARYTDYRSYGSQWTYKAGGLYSPIQAFSLRGSYGTSYRAPALFEQFLGSTTGFLGATTDICNDLAANNQIAAVFAKCRAEGLPVGFQQNNGVTVIGRGGAEAGLKAETSKNLTFGAVLQPTFGPEFGNFSLAVDYYRIQINNGVAQLGVSTLLQGCYTGAHPEYCQFVNRAPFTGPGTGALTVTQTYINVAKNTVKGIDFVASYDRELGPGRFDIGAEAVRTLKWISQVDPDSDPTDFVGSIGLPKWAGTGHVGYKTGGWYFRWGVDFIGHTDDRFITEDLGFDPATYDFHVKDYWLHTASVRWENKRYSVTAGVRNVFDKNPPKITAEDPFVNTISNVPLQSGWDFRGRTFFVNLSAKVF
jgi:outer membrane receptor protein involved in Fe transport